MVAVLRPPPHHAHQDTRGTVLHALPLESARLGTGHHICGFMFGMKPKLFILLAVGSQLPVVTRRELLGFRFRQDSKVFACLRWDQQTWPNPFTILGHLALREDKHAPVCTDSPQFTSTHPSVLVPIWQEHGFVSALLWVPAFGHLPPDLSGDSEQTSMPTA